MIAWSTVVVVVPLSSAYLVLTVLSWFGIRIATG